MAITAPSLQLVGDIPPPPCLEGQLQPPQGLCTSFQCFNPASPRAVPGTYVLGGHCTASIHEPAVLPQRLVVGGGGGAGAKGNKDEAAAEKGGACTLPEAQLTLQEVLSAAGISAMPQRVGCLQGWVSMGAMQPLAAQRSPPYAPSGSPSPPCPNGSRALAAAELCTPPLGKSDCLCVTFNKQHRRAAASTGRPAGQEARQGEIKIGQGHLEIIESNLMQELNNTLYKGIQTNAGTWGVVQSTSSYSFTEGMLPWRQVGRTAELVQKTRE